MKKDKKKKIPFKVLWRIPFYRSLIILGMWAVFFIILFVGVSYDGYDGTKEKYQNKQEIVTSFIKMKEYFTSLPLNIKYKIDDYYISGDINNGILLGTLEDNEDSIIKFKYDGENIYQVKKEEESIQNELFEGYKVNYFLPKNLIDLISDPKIMVIKGSDGLSYSYTIDNVALTFYTDNKYIKKVIILDDNKTYEFEYDVVVSESN